GPVALMVMLPSELKRLVRKAGATETAFSDTALYKLYRCEGKAASSITLTGPFIGAPHAVIALEKLIVLGTKKILVLGWCGSLQPDLRIGDLVIPTSAISEEGTSQHYPVGTEMPQSDSRLNRILEASIKDCGRAFTKGNVWTTDAIYRETAEKVRAYRDQGVLAVEMEISALLTVAHYRSVALTGLLVVSDELFDLRWKHGFSNPLLKKRTQLAGDLLLDLSKTLAG
ncbi:MAG: nucleoside phosphorylase, partial [Deltaproteobacteria bacterium]|nr:nucleoside phosphorylase [Deltaproteobacteria bacterium]